MAAPPAKGHADPLDVLLLTGSIGPPATAPPALEVVSEVLPVPDVVSLDVVDVVVDDDVGPLEVVRLDGRVEPLAGWATDVEWELDVDFTGGLTGGLGFGVGVGVGLGVGLGVASFGGTAPLGVLPDPKENPITDPAGGVNEPTPVVA